MLLIKLVMCYGYLLTHRADKEQHEHPIVGLGLVHKFLRDIWIFSLCFACAHLSLASCYHTYYLLFHASTYSMQYTISDIGFFKLLYMFIGGTMSLKWLNLKLKNLKLALALKLRGNLNECKCPKNDFMEV